MYTSNPSYARQVYSLGLHVLTGSLKQGNFVFSKQNLCETVFRVHLDVNARSAEVDTSRLGFLLVLLANAAHGNRSRQVGIATGTSPAKGGTEALF